MTAEKTATVAFRVSAKTKEKVTKKFNTFEKKKELNQRLRVLYATLLQK